MTGGLVGIGTPLAHTDSNAAFSAFVEFTKDNPNTTVLLVNTARPGGFNEVTTCSRCGIVGLQEDYHGLAREPYCEYCYHRVKDEPGFKVVSYCSRDGSEIYQTWIDRGIATTELCPYCVQQQERTA